VTQCLRGKGFENFARSLLLKMPVDFMVVIPYDYGIIDSQENLIGQVFTSYSRRGTETVDNFVGKLSQAGMSIWIDRTGIVE
jgi:hypothetical protein